MILRGKKLVLMSIPFQIDSAIDSAKTHKQTYFTSYLLLSGCFLGFG